MRCANRTGMTPKGQIFEISFDRVHFSKKIKRAKIQKKIKRDRERKVAWASYGT
jgi:hypothetical protein